MELSVRLREEINVVVLGLAFMVLFSSFNTLENILKPFLSSVHSDNPTFTGDGFIAISIIYVAFAAFLWLAPLVLTRIKTTTALLIGTIGYCLNVAAFYTTSALVIYLCSALNGSTAAFLWSAQGRYVILNSQPHTVTSNTSIFWVFYKCSLFFGNAFVYFVLSNDSHIDKRTRTTIISVLFALNIVSVVILWFLKSPVYEYVQHEDDQNTETTPLKDLAKAWDIFTTPNTIILSVMFFYVGLGIAFNSGLFSAAVGFTKQLGPDSAKLVPLVGIFIGIGEIISGGIQILYGERISQYRWGGPTVVLVGVLIQLVAYTLIFLYLPDSSIFGETNDPAYMKSNVYVALASAVIIGSGDGCFTSQIYSMLKMMYPNDSAQIVSLYIFISSSATALGFYGSTVVGLHIQLIVLSITGVIGSIVFTVVTHRLRKAQCKT